jgi:putative SOS response-associated peptidase YedK
MCGRFTLKSPSRTKFDAVVNDVLRELAPRYNIAPSQNICVVLERDGEQCVEFFQWGLIPSWSKEPKGFINARAETLREKPSFSESFRAKRCLIPADGFFEWKRSGKWRQPYFFQLHDGEPFAFAGIWDTWQSNSHRLFSCAIITTSANEVLAPVHDRMPAILRPESYSDWLSEWTRPDDLTRLLIPFPSEEMRSHPVSTMVNGTDADNPQLVEEIQLDPQPVTGWLF